MTQEHLAAAVAAHGLRSALARFPDRPLDPVDWSALAARVHDGRIPGLLVRAIADGALVASPEQVDGAQGWHTAATGLGVLLDRLLVEVVDVLATERIDTRVLKGAAVAHLDYPDPSLRTFGDVDLLVRARDFDRAVATLVRAGFARRFPELRPGFERRFAKGVPLARDHGFEVDLHRTFVDGPYGLRSHPDDLFDESARFELAGRHLLALSREDRLLHACFHVALSGHLRLSSLRDVGQLVLVSEADGERVQRRARAWNAEPVLARGVARSWELLGLVDSTPLTEWAARYTYDRRARRSLAASVGAGAGWPMKALEGVGAVPGLRAKVAYTRAVVWPSDAFMAGQPTGRFGRWRRVPRHLGPWLGLGRRHARGPGIKPGPAPPPTRAATPGPGPAPPRADPGSRAHE